VLRLYDASLRQAEVIRPAHPRELRVLAVAPSSPGEPQPRQWREWLQPDLIRRCAERRSLVPTICEITSPLARSAAGAGPVPDHAAARGALNIHPPARIAAAGEPVERTVEFVEPRRADSRAGGPPPFDVGTGAPDWLAGAQLAGGQLVGHLLAPAGAVTAGDGPQHLADMTGRGLDPLALRLVFLSQRYRDDMDLSWDTLHTADKTLRRWRESVAEWALSPSLAMAQGYADAVTSAFEDDLDTPAALRQLDALAADGGLPEGAKFETFAALDRLFGLDLARDIGKVSAPRGR
jgi:hypothetical protein